MQLEKEAAVSQAAKPSAPHTPRRLAQKIVVEGIVQGVGFRPFVFLLARHLGLTGEVANTTAGVAIHIEGYTAALDTFRRKLERNPPPLAHITRISVQPVAVRARDAFVIAPSQSPGDKSALISPDAATCEDCRHELFDASDRRHRYPFINCTHCGPRFTIIEGLPYDRPLTAMRHFRLCPLCQAEYDNPADRRFHAQPNACPVCGPRIALVDGYGVPLPGGDPVRAAADLLRAGKILAIKGLGGFHLAVDAFNSAAVSRLRARKGREEKPLALMCPDLSAATEIAHITKPEAELLTASQRPIVLLRQRWPNPLAAAVAPDNRFFGVMLPYTPLHHLLMQEGFRALVMTSGNRSEEPIAIDNNDARQRLGGITDAFLQHDRGIYRHCDDSIVRHVAGGAQLLRRARGYAPAPVFLRKSQPSVLACGAELKSTLCLTKGERAFVSQHLGDLENEATLDLFERTAAQLQTLLEIRPLAIAHDLHPDYLSTRYALQSALPRIAVQHHHAHIAACLAENRHLGTVIGLALDGSGYGPDGTVWGGEALIADLNTFRRAAHFEAVPLPGAAAAIRNPWRMALSYLAQAFEDEELLALPLPPLRTAGRQSAATVVAMTRRQINAPLTSSLGRLFDAVASLAGLRQTAAFEGQAAMMLEMCAEAAPGNLTPYPYAFSDEPVCRILTAPLIRAVVTDLLRNASPAEVSTRFHLTVIRLLGDLCQRLRRDTGLDTVALSGGVFQNALVLDGLKAHLQQQRFTVLTHRLVPTNDGGISLGQAAVAGARIAAGLVAPDSSVSTSSLAVDPCLPPANKRP